MRQSIEDDPMGWVRHQVTVRSSVSKAWFLRLLAEAGEVEMARGLAGKPSATKKAPSKDIWFVNVAVSVEQAPDIELEYNAWENIEKDWLHVLHGGYRTGFNYDASKDAIICSLTCRDDGNPNYNGVLNAFASDWQTALKVVLFKHFHVLDESWTQETGAVTRAAFG